MQNPEQLQREVNEVIEMWANALEGTQFNAAVITTAALRIVMKSFGLASLKNSQISDISIRIIKLLEKVDV